MEGEELLSKKDLLKLTGISYGQLYRWKRQNLIPESWFIKQSSFTGQETYFPKEKILKRIGIIIDLKDQYSLEELAEFLTPDAARRITLKDLKEIQGFSQPLIEKFLNKSGESHLNFKEILFIYLLTKLVENYALDSKTTDNFIESIIGWIPNLKSTAYELFFCEKNNQVLYFLTEHQASLYFDNETLVKETFDLDETAKDLNLKLNKVLEDNHES